MIYDEDGGGRMRRGFDAREGGGEELASGLCEVCLQLDIAFKGCCRHHWPGGMVMAEEYEGGPRFQRTLAMRESGGPWSGGVVGSWCEVWYGRSWRAG